MSHLQVPDNNTPCKCNFHSSTSLSQLLQNVPKIESKFSAVEYVTFTGTSIYAGDSMHEKV